MQGVDQWAILEGKEFEFPDDFEGFSGEGYQSDAESRLAHIDDADLANLVAVWSKLPPMIRAGIMAMVSAIGKKVHA